MATLPSLSGKVALITGAARRIGAAIGRHLHEDGANVVIHYRSSADEALTLCDELNALRPNSALSITGLKWRIPTIIFSHHLNLQKPL